MPESIHHTTLDNGLRVVAQRIPGVSGVGIAVHYRVGFRTESRNRSGFAHLFEHMMFQGSTNVPRGGHFARIQAHGGLVNGHTFPDVTDYYQVVPTAALDEVLDLEADRMAGLAVTDDNLRTQRDVVKQEIRLQVDGRPYGGFPWTGLPAVLYRKWENAHNGYGELADLEAATTDDCADFFDRHYAPGNAVLALCGDLSPETALATARRAFSRVPHRPVPPVPDVSEPRAVTELRATCHDRLAPRPALAVGYRMPDAQTDLPAYAANVVLSHLLTSGATARLRAALAPLDVRVDSSPGLFGPLMAKDPDTFVIVAHHPEGAENKVLEVITAQAADIARKGCTEGEAERAVATAVTSLYQNLDSLAYRVRFLARGALLFNRPTIADDLAQSISATTAHELALAAETLATPAGRAVLHLRPRGDAA
ncbi:insulinase family protein [Streptomyces sp. G44]|uniref:M16 family metallopeptidase n=1 Tax=Streptomyces sp. G44 TaxID=2807632 RepID=UPI0019620996|nr:pitrilysin family protein [Streptomyces sp. G44]MBM7167704.1 insulinase family protein [Streptomyces sp. G44]